MFFSLISLSRKEGWKALFPSLSGLVLTASGLIFSSVDEPRSTCRPGLLWYLPCVVMVGVWSRLLRPGEKDLLCLIADD